MTLSLKDIEWSDFLARPAIESPSPEALRTVFNAPILITGAGGSIGSALSLRLAHSSVPALLLLESGENQLYELERYLEIIPGPSPHTNAATSLLLGSTGDRALLDRLFAEHRPRIVFHAAAYKHVPMLETQPLAAIANNILATETVTAAATRHGARVVLLSTDKAVEPASVMGATKRVAEEIVLAAGGTVLRLGNVLASSGSVTHVFAQQIGLGGPITITAPDARRYFLTLEEAVNLLLRAAVNPGTSSLLAPSFPSTHTIVDLAQFMTRQLSPGCEIPIQFTGLRPGDKVIERMWSDSETARLTGDDILASIHGNRLTQSQLESGLAAFHCSIEERDFASALNQLRSLVPGFNPSSAVLALARYSSPRVFA